MKKALLILLFTFICCQHGWAAEIREYTLNQMKVTDGPSNVKTIPIFSSENKPMTIKLIIAGLETNRVTAQCPMLSLATETQIYPMDRPDNGTGDDGAKWYFVRYNLGVTIIELKGDSVEVYNLGAAPFAYVGTRNALAGPP